MSAPEAKPFDAPWQAHAFALAVHLNERGLFGWDEWAKALSAELHGGDAAEDGSDYYAHWLKALEKVLAAKGIADGGTVDAIAEAWERAAHATPHGKPIMLENDPITKGRGESASAR